MKLDCDTEIVRALLAKPVRTLVTPKRSEGWSMMWLKSIGIPTQEESCIAGNFPKQPSLASLRDDKTASTPVPCCC
jgi:hypothetical protein